MSGRRIAAAGAAATGPLASAAALLIAFAAAGCRPFSGSLPGDPVPAPYSIQHLQGQGTVTVEAELGDAPRDVYLAFVNPQDVSAVGDVTVIARSAGRAVASEPRAVPVAGAAAGLADLRRAPTPAAIAAYNQAPLAHRPSGASSLRLFERPPEPPLLDAVDDELVFYDYRDAPVPATCRAVVGPVAVDGGERTLDIWVADNCWDDPDTPFPDGDRSRLVTPDMVAALADRFLKGGGFDDIYDWVTGMLGAEWGDHDYTDLIAPDNEVAILLCDIDDDDSTEGGLVGYFYSRDNVEPLSEPHSNGRVMFTIDAVLYAVEDAGDADGDGSDWDPTDSWPEEIFSTLAHEFQHMVHFYQRSVLRGASSSADRWINEMASQVVEDLLADKLGVIGPRGVDGAVGSAGVTGITEGRLPRFNARNDASLTTWVDEPLDEALACYSVTYAFGAWLARNYGGALLLNRLMRCSVTGPASIEDIVSQETGHPERFARILQRWGAAQLLSDETDAPSGYRYNAGTFFDSSVNGRGYRLGSIDLFRYSPSPYLYTPENVSLYLPLRASQALCAAAVPGAGTLAWTLELPDGMVASVLVK